MKSSSTRYNVYYAKRPCFKSTGSAHNFKDTHVCIKDVIAEGLDDAYMQMQSEVWSPRGEACELIEKLGLSHTSMSIGDILVTDDYAQEIFEVAEAGWNHLGTILNPRVMKEEIHICPHCRRVDTELNTLDQKSKQTLGGYKLICPECKGTYYYDTIEKRRDPPNHWYTPEEDDEVI